MKISVLFKLQKGSWIMCRVLSSLLPLGGSVFSTILPPEGMFLWVKDFLWYSLVGLQDGLDKREGPLKLYKDPQVLARVLRQGDYREKAPGIFFKLHFQELW